MEKIESIPEGLFHYLKGGVSPFHTVRLAAEEFEQAGYQELELSESWQLERGRGYYVKAYESSLFAFRVNAEFGRLQGFRIAAAHTDWPCMRVKMDPDMSQGVYGKLNVETYGGPILNTWLDRPLSAAGRVTLKGENCFSTKRKLVDFGRAICTIPNLAIHMNRDVNKGMELNKQTDMMPVIGRALEKDLKENDGFIKALAEEAGAAPEELLFFELSLYNCDGPELIGLNREFLSSPRLDNLTSVKACVDGLLKSEGRQKGVDLAAFFDHEEVGSRTKQGAGSELLSLIMEKICRSFHYSDEDCLNSRFRSFLLSVDVAHGVHPNRPEKNDATNQVYLGDGVAIKTESSQKYATDGEAIGIIRSICEKHGIPYGMFANRSDVGSGSTLGSIASSFAVMNTVDVGIPLLAMHSARELMALSDQEALTRLLTEYWREN
ncbi:MAG: M18 family aminopeptidase [Lachnospiraceae bacterium]|nr:M18 family aminopeptidase [Lachnospiraceae bacterium]